MSDFGMKFRQLMDDCPVEKTDAANWAAWMQENGYKQRMHGDLLNGAIVDTLRHKVASQ